MIHPSDLKCWDCHALEMAGESFRCPKHATPAEHAAAAKRVVAVALGNHPIVRPRR